MQNYLKMESFWRIELPELFAVLRKKGTERKLLSCAIVSGQMTICPLRREMNNKAAWIFGYFIF